MCQRPGITQMRRMHRPTYRVIGPVILVLSAISTAKLHGVESNGTGGVVVRTRIGPIRASKRTALWYSEAFGLRRLQPYCCNLRVMRRYPYAGDSSATFCI